MPAPLGLATDQVDQVDRFVAALHAAGLTPWRSTTQAARTFCGRLQRAGGWAQLSGARQLEATKVSICRSMGPSLFKSMGPRARALLLA
jgi:hypothetical protein